MAMLMFDGKLGYTHQRTFRHVYVLGDLIADASQASARRILFRERRRVSELLSAIRTAMLQQPNPPTWEDILQSLSTPTSAGPSPSPSMGEGRGEGEPPAHPEPAEGRLSS